MSPRTLTLVAESRIHALLGLPDDTRLEASGVRVRGARAVIIFDNGPIAASIDISLQPGEANRMIRLHGRSEGFEDITFDEVEECYHVLVEASLSGDGRWKPQVESYTLKGEFIESLWCDFEVASENKGFEGIAMIERGGEQLLLGLCEGNKCADGKKGSTGGGGRIQCFRRAADLWAHMGTIKLPKSLDFADYSALDVVADALIVLSQEESAVWVGRLDKEKLTVVDDGEVFLLPRNKKGKIVYCNVEGISWMGDRQVMVVSDARKVSTQHERCASTHQSVHIFRAADSTSA